MPLLMRTLKVRLTMSKVKQKFTFTTIDEVNQWMVSVRDDFIENGLSKVKSGEITVQQLQERANKTEQLLNDGLAYAKTLRLGVDL